MLISIVMLMMVILSLIIYSSIPKGHSLPQEQFQQELALATDTDNFSLSQAEKSSTKAGILENTLDIKVPMLFLLLLLLLHFCWINSILIKLY